MVDSKNTKPEALELLRSVYVGILLVIFGGIVLHAPISVVFGKIWPDYCLLIKSWKEILMLVAGIIAVTLLYRTKKLSLLRDPILVVIGIYALLHLILLFLLPQSLKSSVAGLAIDLRYVLFFALVYVAMQTYPNCRKLFIKVGIAGALIVLIFALMQVFILPYDVLSYIGYNKSNISPYLVVDQNYDFIRINSTLRGPNPLGAYAVIVLALIMSAVSRHKIKRDRRSLILVAVLSIGGLVALWSSYSRSALVGAVVAIAITLAVTNYRKLSVKAWVIVGGVVTTLLVSFFFVSHETSFISNVLLHENPNNMSVSNSNEEHASSLVNGLNQLISQPLGVGVGSTGSASLYGNRPIIIENQYLFTAHEVGWLGLLLFLSIFVAVLIKLWDLKKDWLALGLFASGIGLALIGLLLPVWVDDTVAIIWWGLAAVALFTNRKMV